MQDELSQFLAEAEKNKENADKEVQEYIEKTKKKIETGHIGQAARLFEEACAYCDTHSIPKDLVAPLGYAIILLQACEKVVQEEEKLLSNQNTNTTT